MTLTTEASAVRKQWLFVSTQAPLAGGAAAACADLLMTAAVFEQDVGLVFSGAGVLQLLPDQDGTALGQKTFTKLFPALELYDVHRVYAEEAALRAFGLDSTALLVPVTVIGVAELRTLLAQSAAVYVF